jgi:antirestriction protein ArdC
MGRNRNGISGSAYRGINVLLTAYSGFTSPFWFSRKQILSQKGKIKKGEKGTMVTFWKFLDKKDKYGQPVMNSAGKPKKIPMFRYYRIWNLEQTEGCHPTPRAEKAAGIDSIEGCEFSPIDAAESILQESPVKPALNHGGNKAYYTPALDRIQMPDKDAFQSPENYYATLFHEMGHSTGHETRLKRDLTGLFGDHSYTKEELIAEMTSAFLCGIVGIDTDAIMENSAAYIDTWRRKISKDVRLVIQAAGQAQKAADKILGTEFKDEQTDADSEAEKTENTEEKEALTVSA